MGSKSSGPAQSGGGQGAGGMAGGMGDVPPFNMPQTTQLPPMAGNSPAPNYGGMGFGGLFGMGGGLGPDPYNSRPTSWWNQIDPQAGGPEPSYSDPYGGMTQSGGAPQVGGWPQNNPYAGGREYNDAMPVGGMPQINPNGVWGGANGPHHMTDDDYLQMLYQTQLGRAPDQGGIDYWRGQLGSGAVNRGQLMDNFRNSAEGQDYQRRMAPMTDDFGRNYQSPEVMDAMRLAQQGGQQQGGQGQYQQGPDLRSALAILSRLGIF